jgi:hypothetical protein
MLNEDNFYFFQLENESLLRYLRTKRIYRFKNVIITIV